MVKYFSNTLSFSTIISSAALILSLISQSCFSDIRVEFKGSFVGPGWCSMTPQLYNTTLNKVDIAGWRFTAPSHSWGNLYGDAGARTKVTIANGVRNQETRLADVNVRVLGFTGETPTTQNLEYMGGQFAANEDGTPSGTYILLKTGTGNEPDPYLDEKPITVQQIDSLMKLPNFYNADFRYVDSLGSHGGTFSGGWIDSYYRETQILIAIPQKEFVISMTNVQFDPTVTGGPLYWMALGMGQEYFGMDMQWELATGFKETFAGLKGINVAYHGSNTDGAFGPFEVEAFTFIARCVAYPKFYPEYATDLSTSANATVFIGKNHPQNVFAGDFMGPDSTPLNSAWVVNALLASGMNYWYLYDLLSYSTDICWRQVLQFCIDPYVGIAALVPLYNLGMNSGAEGPLKVNAYQQLLNDPLARNRFPMGNGNYRENIMVGVQAMVNASRQAFSDKSIPVWDIFITKDDLQRFFFGDGGTVQKQGKGGLLKHFSVDRQKVWGDVEAAFAKLSPHWNKSPAAISYRYDFLTLLRVVKGYFNFTRPRPSDNESADWIKRRSMTGGCAGPEDTEFPYMDVVSSQMENDDFLFVVNATDDKAIKDVQWTADYNWNWWKQADSLSGTPVSKNYRIRVTKDIAQSSTKKVIWVSTTDKGGNTIVKQVPIVVFNRLLLDSCTATDSRGWGSADRILAYFTNGTKDSVQKWSSCAYSWPSATNLKTADKAQVTVAGTVLTISDPVLEGGAGLGLGKFAFDTILRQKDIWDRVGPALRDEAIFLAKSNQSDPDSLIVVVTEPISENLKDNTIYCSFTPTGPKPLQTSRKISDSQWLFIFAANTIAGNDSVRLVANSGLTDVEKNSPHENSKKVRIRIKGAKAPQWILGYIQDTIGTGFGNKITVSIKLGLDANADKPSDCKNYHYSWPTKNTLKEAPIGSVVINNTNLSVYDATFTSGEGRGWAKLVFPSDDNVSGDIIDSVGPALTAALLLEQETGGKDTLLVTLTEPIKENLVENKEYLRVNGTPKKSLKAFKYQSDLRWMFVFEGQTIHEGDMINLIRGSGIVDKAFANDPEHNPPIENNQKVKVEKLKEKIKVSQGLYLDENADGTMDAITLTLSREVSTEEAKKLSFSFVWVAEGSNVNPITMQAPGDQWTNNNSDKKIVHWSVPPQYSLKKFLTAVGSSWGQATISQPNALTGQIVTNDMTVSDGMGPVVKVGTFCPATMDENSVNAIIYDSLIVELSETVKPIVGPQPYGFKTKESKNYAMQLELITQQDASVLKYLVKSKERFPMSGDSLWLYGEAKASDIVSVIQTKDTKPVPLIVGAYTYVYRVIAFPNPCRPLDFETGENQQIKQVWTKYNLSPDKKGILIIVKTFGHVADVVTIDGSVTLFDGLGIPVVRDLRPIQKIDNTCNDMLFLWNLSNDLQRKVGTMSFKAFVTVTESQPSVARSTTKVFPIMLGVKQ
ncbi:MAG: hypothetical protein JW795_13505 [Chitinivibrionales bacterium]|nr:hypothetical protein [Chitinivibrionales bacterium]